MLVQGRALMSDLKVLVEMAFWVAVGSLFHSRVLDGKNEWNDEVRRVCLGIMVLWLRRLWVGWVLSCRRLYRYDG